MSIFNEKIRVGGIPKNKFDLSHERKLTLNPGKLVPIMVEPVVPGDSFKAQSEIFMRFAPMVAPIMHRVDVYTHYFFVPNRIMWDEWEDFITGGEAGNAAPIFPTLRMTQYPFGDPVRGVFGQGSLADYLGLPTLDNAVIPTNPMDISSLPFRAYQMIYNDYYRDQNLEAKIDILKTSGQETQAQVEQLTAIRNRAWGKDYFTSAMAKPQRGEEAFAPVTQWVKASDGSALADGPAAFQGGRLRTTGDVASTGQLLINELRKANKLQEWLEKQARGGGRMFETILSHFGVKISDARVQRPEYLGGGKQHVSISEVLSTYDNTTADLPQGNMSGHGISSGKSHGFNRTFEEHGYIIGIMSVLPKRAYQQGISRHYFKFDKFDHYFPSFANLGEQAIMGKELYYDPLATAGDGNETFGYQSRYAEYKFGMDTVHGDFRGNLDYWHMGTIFENKPLLNNAFIKADTAVAPELTRPFAIQDPAEHHLWCQVYNNISALRPMPYFGTPSL